MPEGDSIFRTARTLERVLAGHRVTRFEPAFPRLTRIDDDSPLRGRTVERVEARGKHLLIWFSGDLVLRIAWPLFVLNSINAFVEEDTGYVSSYRTGEVWRIAVPGSLSSVNLLEPSGAKHAVPVSDGRAVFRGEQAGFYKLTGGSDDAPLGEFAANLSDLEESRIAPQKELVLAGKKATAVSVSTASLRSDIWIYLLLGVIAISLVEWITYHRRVTV